MNTLMMVVVALVVLCYFGGSYCPSVLKKNKEMLLGVAGGLVLCSFFGMRLEGLPPASIQSETGEEQVNRECRRRDYYCNDTTVPAGARDLWQRMCGNC